ncbi:MAG: hypothetical protein ACYSU0_05335 [Planctomycetota bacterium]
MQYLMAVGVAGTIATSWVFTLLVILNVRQLLPLASRYRSALSRRAVTYGIPAAVSALSVWGFFRYEGGPYPLFGIIHDPVSLYLGFWVVNAVLLAVLVVRWFLGRGHVSSAT